MLNACGEDVRFRRSLPCRLGFGGNDDIHQVLPPQSIESIALDSATWSALNTNNIDTEGTSDCVAKWEPPVLLA